MVVALTVTPALGLLLFARGSAATASHVARSPRGCSIDMRALLSGSLRRPRGRTSPSAPSSWPASRPCPSCGPSLSPSFKEPQLLIHMEGAPGTSLPEMARITNQAGRELGSIPGVDNVGAHVGRAVTSDQAVNVNSAELWVSIDPGADYDATVASVRETVEGYPGARFRRTDLLEGAGRRGVVGDRRRPGRARVRRGPAGASSSSAGGKRASLRRPKGSATRA